MHEIGLLRVIIKIYLNFQPWKKVFCRGLWSHNYNTVSTEQALDWQRLLSSETEHGSDCLLCSPFFSQLPVWEAVRGGTCALQENFRLLVLRALR